MRETAETPDNPNETVSPEPVIRKANDLISETVTPPDGLTKLEPPKPVEPPKIVHLNQPNETEQPRAVGIDDLFSQPGETARKPDPVQPQEIEAPQKRGRKPKPVGPPVDYGKLANVMFDMGVGLLTTGFGPEWQPENPDERQMIIDPLATYLESQGFTDLPPGVVLSIVVIAYSAKRIHHPNTKAKLVKIGGKVKGMLGNKKHPINGVN